MHLWPLLPDTLVIPRKGSLWYFSHAGEVAAVQGTGFDLRQSVEVGNHLKKFQLDGFDHNFCLKQSAARQFCAR